MLPFLEPKKITSVLVSKRKSDGTADTLQEEGEHDPGLLSAAEDLISAVHAKDANAVADALKAAYSMCDDDEDPAMELGE